MTEIPTNKLYTIFSMSDYFTAKSPMIHVLDATRTYRRHRDLGSRFDVFGIIDVAVANRLVSNVQKESTSVANV